MPCALWGTVPTLLHESQLGLDRHEEKESWMREKEQLPKASSIHGPEHQPGQSRGCPGLWERGEAFHSSSILIDQILLSQIVAGI